MIYISDNHQCERAEKRLRSVKTALYHKYRNLIAEISPRDQGNFNRVYTAWKEDAEGQEIDRAYMRVWWSGEQIIHLLLWAMPDDWRTRFNEQQAGH